MSGTPFKLRSGNTTPFKMMGSSPLEHHRRDADGNVITHTRGEYIKEKVTDAIKLKNLPYERLGKKIVKTTKDVVKKAKDWWNKPLGPSKPRSPGWPQDEEGAGKMAHDSMSRMDSMKGMKENVVKGEKKRMMKKELKSLPKKKKDIFQKVHEELQSIKNPLKK